MGKIFNQLDTVCMDMSGRLDSPLWRWRQIIIALLFLLLFLLSFDARLFLQPTIDKFVRMTTTTTKSTIMAPTSSQITFAQWLKSSMAQWEPTATGMNGNTLNVTKSLLLPRSLMIFSQVLNSSTVRTTHHLPRTIFTIRNTWTYWRLSAFTAVGWAIDGVVFAVSHSVWHAACQTRHCYQKSNAWASVCGYTCLLVQMAKKFVVFFVEVAYSFCVLFALAILCLVIMLSMRFDFMSAYMHICWVERCA